MRSLISLLVLVFSVPWSAQSSLPDAERELVRLTNEDRAREKAAPLESDELLAQAARTHLQQMIGEHTLSHQFPGEPTVAERIAATGLRFQASGENVAFFTAGHNAKENAAVANDILMHSPPHRENILKRDYNAIGVAMGSDGHDVWVVEDFARAFPSTSAADIEAQVKHAMQEARASHQLGPLRFETKSNLRPYACSNEVSPSRVLHTFPQARSVDIFTVWDASRLSSGALNRASSRETRSAAVTACEVSGPAAHGSYRVIALFF